MVSYPLPSIVRRWLPSLATGLSWNAGRSRVGNGNTGTVEKRIDNWLENLGELETEGVDKRELIQGLEEAKRRLVLIPGSNYSSKAC